MLFCFARPPNSLNLVFLYVEMLLTTVMMLEIFYCYVAEMFSVLLLKCWYERVRAILSRNHVWIPVGFGNIIIKAIVSSGILTWLRSVFLAKPLFFSVLWQKPRLNNVQELILP